MPAAPGKPAAASPLLLRAHHLLCLHGFRGLGYSRRFISNMAAVQRRVWREAALAVHLGCAPDAICAACPHLEPGGCGRRPGAERRARAHDRRVLKALGLRAGAFAAPFLLDRVRWRVGPARLASLCPECEWRELGYCAEGLAGKQESHEPAEKKAMREE